MVKKMLCACALALCTVVCANAQDNNEKKSSVFFYAGPQVSTAKCGGGMSLSGKFFNPAKRNVLDLKNETCKNREKRNVLKISHTRHFKTTKKQSKTGCFYCF